jgi:hypothetical protein
MKNKVTLLVAVVFLVAEVSTAQDIRQNRFAIKTGIIVEQISLPTFRAHGSRTGLGFTLGTEISYSKGSNPGLFQTVDLVFYAHKGYGYSTLISSQFAIRPRIKNFHVDIKAGPAFMLFYNQSSAYYKGDSGYEKASPLQNKLAGILTLAGSYQTGTVRPYVAYSLAAEYPFIKSASAILPHQILEAGLYFNLKKNLK